jgi:DNA-binding NtrC family response regulator
MTDEKKFKALIVDDEKVVRDFLVRFLRLKGIEAKAVEDGYQAIELARQEEFNLLFAEANMRKMDGLQIFREIKKIRPGIKFIMTTGSAMDEMLEQGKKEGAIASIRKPFDFDELNTLIDSIIE